jgi:hypothetical protein
MIVGLVFSLSSSYVYQIRYFSLLNAIPKGSSTYALSWWESGNFNVEIPDRLVLR